MSTRSNAMVLYKRKAPSKRTFRKSKSTALVRYRPGIPNYPKDVKTNDIGVAVYAGDTTGSITLLNGIQTGDDFNTRDGRQIQVKSVHVHGRVFSADNSVANCFARMMLIWDTQANGAAPASLAAIMTAATSASFVLDSMLNRFRVLADMKFVTGLVQETATQAIAYSPNVHVVDCYRKVNRTTQYIGTDAVIASIGSGALYLVTMGDQVAGSGSTFNLACRVRFVDI